MARQASLSLLLITQFVLRSSEIYIRTDSWGVQAFAAISGAAANLTSELITVVLANHIIEGSTIYSPLIKDGGAFKSSLGQALTFTVNSTGKFVTSGASTAKIVSTDYLSTGGVMHVIDSVLLNIAGNPNTLAANATSLVINLKDRDVN